MRHLLNSRLWQVTGAAVLVAAVTLLTATGATSARLTVCTTGCQYTTIAAALAAANDGDTITVGPGTYSGEFTIGVSVRLVGAGPRDTKIVGRGVNQSSPGPAVVTIASGTTVSISQVKVTRGFSQFFGGGIDNSGSLTLRDALVDDNFAATGGGIYNHVGASATVFRSTISDNIGGSIENPAGAGGGIFNEGTIALQHTRLVGNGSGGDAGSGAGIYNTDTGTAVFRKSRIVDNVVDGFFGGNGGGIENGGTMTLWRTPVVENTVHSGDGAASGGGISNSGRLTLVRSWVTENVASGAFASGGGVANGGSITLIKSGVIRNVPDNCVGC